MDIDSDDDAGREDGALDTVVGEDEEPLATEREPEGRMSLRPNLDCSDAKKGSAEW